jgi:Xaa-Pro aminopeptidase
MKERIKVLQKKLAEGGIDAALLIYSRDVLYYTGTAQPSCLLVTPGDYTLYIRSGLEFAVQDVFIGREKIREERRLEKILAGALSRLAGKPGKIGSELDILTAEQFEALRKACPGVDFVNISPVTLEQRKVKEPGEIERLRRACVVGGLDGVAGRALRRTARAAARGDQRLSEARVRQGDPRDGARRSPARHGGDLRGSLPPRRRPSGTCSRREPASPR